MRMRLIVCLGLAVLIAAAFYYQAALNRQPPDTEQIVALLEKGQFAVERKDVRAAFSLISRDYHDSVGLNYTSVRAYIVDAMRSDAQPDVTIMRPAIRIKGDKAEVEARVLVTDLKGAEQPLFDHDLIISLRKEKARKYLIFSTHAWRIAAVEGLQGVMSEF